MAERLPTTGTVEAVYHAKQIPEIHFICGYDVETRAQYKTSLDKAWGMTIDQVAFEGTIEPDGRGEGIVCIQSDLPPDTSLVDTVFPFAILDGLLDYPDACVRAEKLPDGGYEVEYDLPMGHRGLLCPDSYAKLPEQLKDRVQRVVYRIDADGRLIERSVPGEGFSKSYVYWEGSRERMPIVEDFHGESGWRLVEATYHDEPRPEIFQPEYVERRAIEFGVHDYEFQRTQARQRIDPDYEPLSQDDVMTQLAGNAATKNASEATGAPSRTQSTTLIDWRLLSVGAVLMGVGVVIAVRRNA